jgi:hypothetical protein
MKTRIAMIAACAGTLICGGLLPRDAVGKEYVWGTHTNRTGTFNSRVSKQKVKKVGPAGTIYDGSTLRRGQTPARPTKTFGNQTPK